MHSRMLCMLCPSTFTHTNTHSGRLFAIVAERFLQRKMIFVHAGGLYPIAIYNIMNVCFGSIFIISLPFFRVAPILCRFI